MSDSAGASATFVSPTSSTAGLQTYQVENPALNLYPGPDVSDVRRAKFRRLLTMRWKPKASNQQKAVKKDHDYMHDTIEAMVLTLSKSVQGIVDAASDDRDALLTKSFGEFKEALLSSTSDALAKAAPKVEEPLFKGLGCVGRIAGMLQSVARMADCAKTGKDYSSDEVKDPCSPEVADMLDHMVAVGELALRAAVNEHVDFPDDGEEPQAGMHYIAVPMLSGGEAVVKCGLPEDLAKLATDPDEITAGLIESGAAMMMSAGVPQATLEKALTGGNLAKAFPPAKKKTPSSDTDNSDNGSDDPGSDDIGADDAGGDDTDSSMSGDQSQGMPGGDISGGDDPLSVLGQILAAAMIQLNHIQEMVEGGNADTGPAADPVAPQGSNVGMMKRAPEPPAIDAAALEKIVNERLENQLSELRPMIQKFLEQPAVGKAVVGVAASPALLKAADTGGKPEGPSNEQLAKMSADEKFMVLAKAAFKRPVVSY